MALRLVSALVDAHVSVRRAEQSGVEAAVLHSQRVEVALVPAVVKGDSEPPAVPAAADRRIARAGEGDVGDGILAGVDQRLTAPECDRDDPIVERGRRALAVGGALAPDFDVNVGVR